MLMKKEKAIDILTTEYGFLVTEIGTPAMEFYINGLMNHSLDVCDIDRWAHLNTLIGYKIPFSTAMKIDDWLWDEERNGDSEYETLEMGYKDKPLLERCNRELDLGLSFDKWRTDDFKCYEYF